MSDTPRTDLEISRINFDTPVMAGYDFARQLERELDDLKRQLADTKKQLGEANASANRWYSQAITQNSAAERQLASLQFALDQMSGMHKLACDERDASMKREPAASTGPANTKNPSHPVMCSCQSCLSGYTAPSHTDLMISPEGIDRVLDHDNRCFIEGLELAAKIADKSHGAYYRQGWIEAARAIRAEIEKRRSK